MHTFRVGANELSDVPYAEWRVNFLGTRPAKLDNSTARIKVLQIVIPKCNDTNVYSTVLDSKRPVQLHRLLTDIHTGCMAC